MACFKKVCRLLMTLHARTLIGPLARRDLQAIHRSGCSGTARANRHTRQPHQGHSQYHRNPCSKGRVSVVWGSLCHQKCGLPSKTLSTFLAAGSTSDGIIQSIFRGLQSLVKPDRSKSYQSVPQHSERDRTRSRILSRDQVRDRPDRVCVRVHSPIGGPLIHGQVVPLRPGRDG